MSRKKRRLLHRKEASQEGKSESVSASVPGRIPLLTSVSLIWLFLVGGFSLGVFVYSAQVWPYPTLKQIRDFVVGDTAEDTTLFEKVMNDLDLTPFRHIERLDINANYTPHPGAKEIEGLSLNPRRDKPKMYLSEKAPKGYRIIFGVMDFSKSRLGAILIAPDGTVANIWHMSQEDVPWPHERDSNVYPHGDIAPDGSLVAIFSGGTSMIKYDYCGKPQWKTFGGFHHSVDLDDEGALWAWGNKGSVTGGTVSVYGRNMVKVDYKTGHILKMFHMMDLMRMNPDIDIFGIRQFDMADIRGIGKVSDGKRSVWVSPDPGTYWHVNDIEPLPQNLAGYYPQFKAGDLLASLRAIDLIFVLDPNTLKVKWWRQGLTRRQHDPDWNAKGTITILDNNMHRSYSRIVEIDPKNMKHRTLLDGKKYDFYTFMKGTHDYLPDGGLLITSSVQGRVFEVNEEGEVVFEFINSYGTNDETGELEFLQVSDAKFLPVDFFEELPKCD